MQSRGVFPLSIPSSQIRQDEALAFTKVNRNHLNIISCPLVLCLTWQTIHGDFSFIISYRATLFVVYVIPPGSLFESIAAEDDDQYYRMEIEKKCNSIYKPPY